MLSLAIHELLTNALKYGALANETGQLLIAWRIEALPSGRHLELEWIERGITPQLSTVDPRRIGYGRMLIEEALPYSIGATTRYDIGAERLHCLISVPLSSKSAEGIAK
jgi:two-component sensor histidine kinase